MDRVKTGISGLDELLKGGIPTGSSVLVSGATGTGKSILAMQYIYSGAKDFDEPGLLITLEGNVKNILWNMHSFDWDIKKLQDEKLMGIYKLDLNLRGNSGSMNEKISMEIETISAMVRKLKVKRLVVDSTTAFGVWVSDLGSIRSLFYKFCNALKDMDCTTILTSETKAKKNMFSAFGVEEFVADGVIALYFTPPHRSIFVRKMRGTEHSMAVHPFEITDKGVNVKSKEKVLWEAIK